VAGRNPPLILFRRGIWDSPIFWSAGASLALWGIGKGMIANEAAGFLPFLHTPTGVGEAEGTGRGILSSGV